MSFLVSKSGILDVFAAQLDGFPREYMIWANDVEPFIGPVDGLGSLWGLLVVTLTSDVSDGEDEERSEFNASTSALHIDQITTGVITLTITTRQFDEQEAFDVLRKLRTRLGRDSVQVALGALGLAVAEKPRITGLNLTIDHKSMRYAALEVKLNFVVIDDVTGDKGNPNGTDNWIQQTNIALPPGSITGGVN